MARLCLPASYRQCQALRGRDGRAGQEGRPGVAGKSTGGAPLTPGPGLVRGRDGGREGEAFFVPIIGMPARGWFLGPASSCLQPSCMPPHPPPPPPPPCPCSGYLASPGRSATDPPVRRPTHPPRPCPPTCSVYLASPDGHELVRELSFEVLPGRSVIIQGPNGSGKSSLFRWVPASAVPAAVPVAVPVQGGGGTSASAAVGARCRGGSGRGKTSLLQAGGGRPVGWLFPMSLCHAPRLSSPQSCLILQQS